METSAFFKRCRGEAAIQSYLSPCKKHQANAAKNKNRTRYPMLENVEAQLIRITSFLFILRCRYSSFLNQEATIQMRSAYIIKMPKQTTSFSYIISN